MERNYAMINGVNVDVTTVMDTRISYTPTREMVENVRTEMRDIINEYLPNRLNNETGLYDITDPNGVYWKNKGWIISAMEKHPQYNGKMQIVIPGTPMNRHINIDDIGDFFMWAINELIKDSYHLDPKGHKITDVEARELIDKLEVRMQMARSVLCKFTIGNDTPEFYYDIRRTARRIRAAADRKIDKLYTLHYIHQKEISALGIIRDWVWNNKPDVQFSDDNLAMDINRIMDDERFCASNQRISRIINKICKKANLHKIVDIRDVSFYDANGILRSRTKDFGWNGRFASLGDAINPISETRTAVISVHPVDYLTMSFGRKWASCHTIDKENRRRVPDHNYSGCYCGGTVSYMIDTATVVFYFLPEEYDGTEEHLELLDKEKRCLFYLGEDKLIQSRVYPDGRDGGEESLAGDIRKIMQKLVADLFDVPNYWSNKGGTSACREVIYHEGVQYPDYFNYNDCNVSYMKRIDGYKNMNSVYVGRMPICLECGEEHGFSESIFCKDCHKVHFCADCGCVVNEDDGYYFDGDWYCSDCVEYCSECNEYHPRREMEKIGDGYVCSHCLDYYYVYSDSEGEYIREEDAVCTEEGNYYPDDSDDYGQCAECDEYHDIDELIYDDETGNHYCAYCYANLVADRQQQAEECDEDIA